MSLSDELPVVVYWTPKAGSGATTVAAASALRAAEHGPTLVVDLATDQWRALRSYPPCAATPIRVDEAHSPDPQSLIDYAGLRISDNLTLLQITDDYYSSGPAGKPDTVADFCQNAATTHNVVIDAGADIDDLRTRLGERGAHDVAVMRLCTLGFAATLNNEPLEDLVIVSEPGRVLTVDDLAASFDGCTVHEVPYSAEVAFGVDRGFVNTGVPAALKALPLPQRLTRGVSHTDGQPRPSAPSLSDEPEASAGIEL